MSDLSIGQRVRAKHDHAFEREVMAFGQDGYGQDGHVLTRSGGMYAWLPASWLEPVPMPLNPLVPWDVLQQICANTLYYVGIDAVNAKLREAGYGPAEETR